MLREYGAEKASLVVILRIESHALGKSEWVLQDISAFLVVVISVYIMEHSLAQSVGLAFFAFPFGHRWPCLVPEGRVVLALATMEDFPL